MYSTVYCVLALQVYFIVYCEQFVQCTVYIVQCTVYCVYMLWQGGLTFGLSVYLAIVNTDFRSSFFVLCLAFHQFLGYPGS